MIRTPSFPSLPSLFLLLLAASCSTPAVGPAEGLRQARAVWEGQAWVDYRYDFQRECFCVEDVRAPVTITVRGGSVAEVRSRTDGSLLPTDGLAPWPTVAMIFDEIEAAQAAGEPVEVAYGEDGLPRRVEIGRIEVDAGVVYYLDDFRPLD